jgi:hypothetical protein
MLRESSGVIPKRKHLRNRRPRPIRGESSQKNTARSHFDSFPDDFRAKKRYFAPLNRNSIRLSLATFIESPRFVGTGGLNTMRAKRKRAKAAASKGAAKKAKKGRRKKKK